MRKLAMLSVVALLLAFGLAVPRAEPAAAAGPAPAWQLPWPAGVSWQAGSPHGTSNGSLDFGPSGGGTQSVVAIAAGTVYVVACGSASFLGVDHGGGWRSTYYHLINEQRQLVGQVVQAGTRLGDAGQAVPCGGSSTFNHVHLTIFKDGVRQSADGLSIGGYTAHSDGRGEYYGYWTRNSDSARVITNNGAAACCLASTTQPTAPPVSSPPDADLDGIPDTEDACVRSQGPAAFSGCSSDVVESSRQQTSDFDGDGRADYCRLVGGQNGVESYAQCTLATATATGFGATHTSGVLDYGYESGRAWVDADGDGRTDYCRRVGENNGSNSRVQCTLSAGNGFGATRTSEVLDWGYETGRSWVDFDGDGRADYCRVVGENNGVASRVQCTMSTSGGFGATVTSPVIDWGYAIGRAWADVNGDSRADFCRLTGENNGANSHVTCTLSSGSSFGTTVSSGVVDWGFPDGREWADLNGDRKADYCRVVGENNGVASRVQCTLSTGTGFGATVTSPVLDWGYETGRAWTDFNGDGKADYCRRVGEGNGSNSHVACTLGGSSSFGSTFQSGVVDWGYETGRAWADVSGDGRADYCRRVGGANGTDSHVRCLLSAGTGFGADPLSGVLDYGYDAGRAWAGRAPGERTAPLVTSSASAAVALASSTRFAYGATDAGSGVKSYDVRVLRTAYNGSISSWAYPPSWQATSATSVTNPLPAGYGQCFSARARDKAGNTSAWSGLRCSSRPLDDGSATSSGFTRNSSSSYFLGTYSYATRTGTSLSKAGVVAKRFGVVAQTCPTCGAVAIYSGSTKLGTISLYSSTTKYQRVLMLPVRSSLLTGTVSVRVTSSGKPVRLDGLVVSRV